MPHNGVLYQKTSNQVNLVLEVRAIQFSSFSGHFREDRDSEIAPTEERQVFQDILEKIAIRRSLLQGKVLNKKSKYSEN